VYRYITLKGILYLLIFVKEQVHYKEKNKLVMLLFCYLLQEKFYIKKKDWYYLIENCIFKDTFEHELIL